MKRLLATLLLALAAPACFACSCAVEAGSEAQLQHWSAMLTGKPYVRVFLANLQELPGQPPRQRALRMSEPMAAWGTLPKDLVLQNNFNCPLVPVAGQRYIIFASSQMETSMCSVRAYSDADWQILHRAIQLAGGTPPREDGQEFPLAVTPLLLGTLALTALGIAGFVRHMRRR